VRNTAGSAHLQLPIAVAFEDGRQAALRIALAWPGDVVGLDPRTVMRTWPPSGVPQEPQATAGRILRAGRPTTEPYRSPEEEIASTGVRVVRTVGRARWKNGSTHVWIA
jgi:hypothetical protein